MAESSKRLAQCLAQEIDPGRRLAMITAHYEAERAAARPILALACAGRESGFQIARDGGIARLPRARQITHTALALVALTWPDLRPYLPSSHEVVTEGTALHEDAEYVWRHTCAPAPEPAADYHAVPQSEWVDTTAGRLTLVGIAVLALVVEQSLIQGDLVATLLNGWGVHDDAVPVCGL